MELLNATKMQAGYTLGMKPDGREVLVVVVKGTFAIPGNGEVATLTDTQEPLLMADTFSGEPGLSAPVYESDFAPHKPKCDVLLNGSCYAPRGTPASKVTVSLRVGSFSKSFSVVGDRVWKKRLFFVTRTKPVPFTVMPISYDRAFGGEDRSHKKVTECKTIPANPVGIGFHHRLKGRLVNGKPLPNTEELRRPVKHPRVLCSPPPKTILETFAARLLYLVGYYRKSYRPMAFGPIGRNWEPRPALAGTYDQSWIDHVFPFLPADFNDAYYQAVPPDQQTDYLRGGEEVTLGNLTPSGETHFRLPTIDMPVVFFPRDGEKQETRAVIDTLTLEPDLGRFMLVWRSSFPLKRNIFDVVQVVAGVMPKGWYRARELGKTYYRSLGELVAAKMRERGEAEWEE
jgi:hypothetical protein